MRIVRIFAERLFAIHNENEVENEFDRLMELWTDVSYLYGFAKRNNITNKEDFVEGILRDAEEIQDYLYQLSNNYDPYGFYFEPLEKAEKKHLLSLQKGKIRQNKLRYYAIKIDNDCYLITGGAIKMSQRMQDHPDTNNELIKLRKARKHLHNEGVFDTDSFFELLKEQP